MEEFRRFAVRPRDRGHVVSQTHGVAAGDPTFEPGTRLTALPALIDAGHEDRAHTITKNPELRGWTETETYGSTTLDVSNHNFFYVAGGALSIPGPPSAPSSQYRSGDAVRRRGARIFVATSAAVTWPSNVKWGDRVVIEGGTATTTSNPPDFNGPVDVFELVWFESMRTWFANTHCLGASPVQSHGDEETAPADDPNDPDNPNNLPFIPTDAPPGSHSNVYPPGDVVRPTKTPTGARLFMLGSAGRYALSANGGYSWTFGVGPYSSAVASTGRPGGNEIAVVETSGGIETSYSAASAWTELTSSTALVGSSVALAEIRRDGSGSDVAAVGSSGLIALREGGTWRATQASPLGSASLSDIVVYTDPQDPLFWELSRVVGPFAPAGEYFGGDLTQLETPLNWSAMDALDGISGNLQFYLSVFLTMERGSGTAFLSGNFRIHSGAETLADGVWRGEVSVAASPSGAGVAVAARSFYMPFDNSPTGRIVGSVAGITDSVFAFSIPDLFLPFVSTENIEGIDWDTYQIDTSPVIQLDEPASRWLAFATNGDYCSVEFVDGAWEFGEVRSSGVSSPKCVSGGGVLVVCGSGVVKRSTDGLSWSIVTPGGLSGTLRLTYAASVGKFVGVSSGNGTTYVSTNGAASWTAYSVGPLAGHSGAGWCLVAGGRTFAGLTGTADLFWSDTYGTAWKVAPPLSTIAQIEVEQI